MSKDPLFQQSEQETERLVADRKVMAFAGIIAILKVVTGLVALALIAAIWLVWQNK
jgi:hypothetical protein